MNYRKEMRATLNACRGIETPNCVDAKSNSPLMRLSPVWQAATEMAQADIDDTAAADEYLIENEKTVNPDCFSIEKDWPALAGFGLFILISTRVKDDTAMVSIGLLLVLIYLLFFNDNTKIKIDEKG